MNKNREDKRGTGSSNVRDAAVHWLPDSREIKLFVAAGM